MKKIKINKSHRRKASVLLFTVGAAQLVSSLKQTVKYREVMGNDRFMIDGFYDDMHRAERLMKKSYLTDKSKEDHIRTIAGRMRVKSANRRVETAEEIGGSVTTGLTGLGMIVAAASMTMYDLLDDSHSSDEIKVSMDASKAITEMKKSLEEDE